MRIKIPSLAFLLLLPFFQPAQSQEKRSELGFSLGWGGPAGNGVEYAYYLSPSQTLDIGLGFSMAGAKYAAGYRYYFLPDRGATPFLGLTLSRAGGLSPLNVTVNGDSAEYRIRPGYALAPRAGFRFRTRLISWYVNTGYHFVLSGGGTEYLAGNPKQSIKDVAEVLALGGLELGGGTMFRF